MPAPRTLRQRRLPLPEEVLGEEQPYTPPERIGTELERQAWRESAARTARFIHWQDRLEAELSGLRLQGTLFDGDPQPTAGGAEEPQDA